MLHLRFRCLAARRLPPPIAIFIAAVALASAASAGPPEPPANTALFQSLDGLAGGSNIYRSRVADMTPDGSVIVGSTTSERTMRSAGEALLWDWEDGALGLGDLEGPVFHSHAKGVSDDGEVVVGQGSNSYANAGAAFRWDADSGMLDLGILPGGEFASNAMGISGDGQTIVGISSTPGPYLATRWTEADGLRSLDGLPAGFTPTVAHDASFDGSVIVGYGDAKIEGSNWHRAFRWESSTGVVNLGALPNSMGRYYSRGWAVSADGTVVVGMSYADSGEEAFRWDALNGMTSLGPGLVGYDVAYGVSSDGRFIVGGTDDEAFVWDEDTGIRLVRDILENDYGIDLGGWRLWHARKISDNGRVIAGNGRNPDGHDQGWVAVLPAPRVAVEIDIEPGRDPNRIRPFSQALIPVAILGSESFDVADVDVGSLSFGPAGAAPLGGRKRLTLTRDTNHDGYDDLTSFYRTGESGIAAWDYEACITGRTLDDSILEGCDAIITGINCGKGFELALLAPLALVLQRRRR